MFHKVGRILPYNGATGAEVLETLFSGEDNASNKIVNTFIQLIIDNDIEKDIYRSNSLPRLMPMDYYNNLKLLDLIFILFEFMEIDFYLGEATIAGINVTISEDSVLMKMVKNYQKRKALAMTGSLLIDEEFYGACVDKLKQKGEK
jgi:hypothetical protein